MAKIRHIALTTDNPRQVAEFYKSALDMEEIRENENGAIFLSDGYINLAILNWKTEKDADVGPNGPNYNGIHHIGFQVEDLHEACQKLESVNGTAFNSREGLESIPPKLPEEL
jgi:catechol 2,3-dioxygenase-like lactoylglutathione lyase family enzyme